DELHEPAALAHGARTSVGREREAADAVLTAALLHLPLGEAHGRNLGPGVDHRRDGLVVHVRRLTGDHLRRHHAFLLGLVREHRSGHAVADGVHVRQVGAHLVVDEDFAAAAHGETEPAGIDAGERGAATDGDEHVIALDGLLCAILLEVEQHAIAIAPAAHDSGGRADLETLTPENAIALLHDVVVHAGKNGGHELDDGDPSAEAAPHGSELEADDA